MRKLLALMLVVLMTVPGFCLAEESKATELPKGVTFQMDYDAVLAALGEGVAEDEWEEDVGTLMLSDTDAGIGDLKASEISFQVDRNNSGRVSRLSQIDLYLPGGENSIASFREALAAITAVYGEPDGDPFDAAGVEGYVEYGGLHATWTKPDVRINLSLSRMYQESMSLDFSNRLCYDADDLK